MTAAHRAPAGALPGFTPPAALLCLAALCFLAALGGCASTAADVPTELLDERTGVTLLRMDQPLELVATAPRAKGSDPFAFAAPFATDRMGAHSYFVWISVPGDDGVVEAPRLLCDGVPLELQATGAGLASLGLAQRPYPQPAPWSSDYYYRLDGAALRAFAKADRIAVLVRYAKGGEVRFEGAAGPRLHAFRERLGPG